MKFYENLSFKSRVFAFGETDGRTEMTKFRPLPSSAMCANLLNFGRFFCPFPLQIKRRYRQKAVPKIWHVFMN